MKTGLTLLWQIEFKHNYDIVKGLVANDRVYASFALYEGGILSKEALRDCLNFID